MAGLHRKGLDKPSYHGLCWICGLVNCISDGFIIIREREEMVEVLRVTQAQRREAEIFGRWDCIVAGSIAGLEIERASALCGRQLHL